MSKNILLVEDDYFLRDGLNEILQKEGYAVTATDCTKAAYKSISENKYELIILDVMLPDGSGLEFCSNIRDSGNETPVLFLTACDDEIQIVRGLDAGGDDYVTKPFRLQELLSRIRALLRRTTKSETLERSGISVDIGNMTVKKDGENVFLTPTEFQILSVLMRNRGIIVTRTVLLQNIWDDNGVFIDDNTLSVHVSRLREKIGSEHIKTVRGVGYRWEDKNDG